MICIFRLGGNKRPDRSADGSWLDHQAWTKIVMAAGLGIIVYFTINREVSYETPLAKQKDFLNGKRSQNSLCAPAYKAEIKKLGNMGNEVYVAPSGDQISELFINFQNVYRRGAGGPSMTVWLRNPKYTNCSV